LFLYNLLFRLAKMQVHAVPEAERAFHPVTGERLPWGYEYYE
jgi:hypothetical protein